MQVRAVSGDCRGESVLDEKYVDGKEPQDEYKREELQLFMKYQQGTENLIP